MTDTDRIRELDDEVARLQARVAELEPLVGEARFRAVVENSYDVINLFSATGELIYTSPSIKRVLGYEPGELIGTTGPVLIHPDDKEEALQNFAAFIDKPNAVGHFVHRLRHKDGTYRTVEVTGTNLLHEPGVNAMVSIFRDVTDRIRAEEELRYSERRFRTLVQNAPDAIMVLDVERQRFIEVNDNATALFGFNRDEFLTLHPRRLSAPIQPDGRTFDEQLEALMPGLLSGEQFTFEWFHRRADGREFPSEVRLTAIPSTDGCQIRGSVVDITRRKKQAERLREQELALAHVSRLSTLGEMVAGIAHEINQPLSAISSFASACNNVINSPDAPTGSLPEWTQQISEQAVRCGDIIRRLRDFVKKNDQHRSQLNLNDVARESVALINPDLRLSSVSVILKLEPSLPPINANQIQIEQVLVNLLRNACEAMHDQDSENRTVTLFSTASTETVLLTVQDQGPGIPQPHADRLFDTFFTTKPDGMGMGLAISKSIVEAHGGRLWVDRFCRQGAAFNIELPITSSDLGSFVESAAPHH